VCMDGSRRLPAESRLPEMPSCQDGTDVQAPSMPPLPPPSPFGWRAGQDKQMVQSSIAALSPEVYSERLQEDTYLQASATGPGVENHHFEGYIDSDVSHAHGQVSRVLSEAAAPRAWRDPFQRTKEERLLGYGAVPAFTASVQTLRQDSRQVLGSQEGTAPEERLTEGPFDARLWALLLACLLGLVLLILTLAIGQAATSAEHVPALRGTVPPASGFAAVAAGVHRLRVSD